MNREPDWALWRSFAAVVAYGSLSAAARELGISQPTVGRHIEALEADLGLTLFERTLSGLKPNGAALRLFEPVSTAQAALAEAAILAEGAQAEYGGTVRITASAIISNYVLPGLLGPIRERYPAIALELVPSDSAENLLLREADIAIRMFRPTQLELVTRKLGELAIIACAHQHYLDRRGAPQKIEDLYQHDLIGFDRSDLIVQHSRAIGFPLTRDNFVLRSDDQPHLWELLKASLGIGFAQEALVHGTFGMVVLPLDLSIPPLPVWLTTHRELFTSHRIRAIYDALAEGLAAYIGGEHR
ncbi:LysR family transcriptional regulator [Devosia sp. RR2S18]|uniref:LysR family transcriptional regulator n=1 Tax=Devosia rhizosphaerae TaxID=3049774 RepID=UPI0025420E00|nr:LysR family transcriptional regulator [Devosia sp. RR2S18]WIJ25625.1 LysR family transcriptional regulator [Devosia sp. RR2S18]